MHLDSSVAYTHIFISGLDLMPGFNPIDRIFKKIQNPLAFSTTSNFLAQPVKVHKSSLHFKLRL